MVETLSLLHTFVHSNGHSSQLASATLGAPLLVSIVFVVSRRGDSGETIALSPSPSMERRGSRARRRMLTVDTGLVEDTCNNGGVGAEQGYDPGGVDDNPPVIDTTSVEVKRKADGKQVPRPQLSL